MCEDSPQFLKIEATDHQINDKDCDIAKRRTTRSQVGERFVTRSVNDQETRQLVLL